MNTDELFVDAYKLPKPLCKKEVYELLDKMKQGDEEAKEKIVKHNIRLVLHQVSSRFKNVEYDKRDLVSVGIVGLMKAILNFDTSKKVEFATFAVSCIDNEILMFLKKLKRYATEDSFDKIIAYDNDGDELTIEAMLSDNTDIVEEYIETERHSVVRKIVKDLPERDREIIMLHFGFYNDKIYTQREIASMLSISRSYVSRLVTRILREIRQQLEEKGYGELRSKQIEEEKIKNKKEGGKKMPRELKTIYEYFNSYTKEQIDDMLKKLSEEDMVLITRRYGKDLENPVSKKLSKEQASRFYSYLVPKMRKLLKDPNAEIKTRKRGRVTSKTTAKGLKTSEIENTMLEQVADETKPIVETTDAMITSEKTSIEIMSKEECVKILDLLRTPSFNQMLGTLSVKEAVIISLKLGYVDGKYFTTQSIAEFLGIEEQEVIDTTKKVLLLYKENINQFIDSAIQIATEEPKSSSYGKLLTK